MRSKALVLVAVFLMVVAPVGLANQKSKNKGVGKNGVPPGQPFQALLAQIVALQGEVAILQDHASQLMTDAVVPAAPVDVSMGCVATEAMVAITVPAYVAGTISVRGSALVTYQDAEATVVNLYVDEGEDPVCNISPDATPLQVKAIPLATTATDARMDILTSFAVPAAAVPSTYTYSLNIEGISGIVVLGSARLEALFVADQP